MNLELYVVKSKWLIMITIGNFRTKNTFLQKRKVFLKLDEKYSFKFGCDLLGELVMKIIMGDSSLMDIY